jgi:phage host-nuclease inhibitor protein Gam
MTDVKLAEIIEKTIAAQMAPVISRLESIQRSVDLLKEDLDNDRKDFALMRTSQETVERLCKEVVDMYANIVRKVGQKADEKTEEAIDKASAAVAGLVEPAMDRAATKIKKGIPIKKKSWWKELIGH